MDTKDIYHGDDTGRFAKHTCPYCGSDKIWRSYEQVDGGWMELFYKCDSCNKEWTDSYEMIYSHTKINIYKED